MTYMDVGISDNWLRKLPKNGAHVTPIRLQTRIPAWDLKTDFLLCNEFQSIIRECISLITTFKFPVLYRLG